MGPDQHTADGGGSASGNDRTRPRVCLRKGCQRTFQPRRWNQRYCQDPECLREVRRWLAAKRQHAHRRDPEHRHRHAAAEAERRQRRRNAAPVAGQHEVADQPQPRAWSRSKWNSADFCDRPGCYEPRRSSPRAPSRYCCDACCQAVQRVRDRERKWLKRHRYTQCSCGRTQTRPRRTLDHEATRRHIERSQNAKSLSVLDYRVVALERLSSHDHSTQERHHDDPKTRAGPGSRPPPTR
jgi:hypothetical protein